MPITCPKCGAESPDGARFCEADGTPLGGDADLRTTSTSSAAPAAMAFAAAEAGSCAHCHAPADANEDGWCSACGRRWRTAPVAGREHKAIVIGTKFGGVTDIGKRHPVNEDDFALAVADRAVPAVAAAKVLVVCDGVSSSEDAQRASAIAAKSICDAMAAAVDDEDIGNAFVSAIASANTAVNSLAPATPGVKFEPPETTVVAALVRDSTVVVAWVGDSRAYWLRGDDKESTPISQQLTRDHSWMNDVIESGEMTPEDAQKNHLAHAITRCLGGGNSDDPDGSAPSVVTFTAPEDASGWLLLCTDGLWNYCDSIEQISGLVAAAENEGAAGDATAISRWLVAWANAQGGRDNITAAMIRLGE